MKRINSQMWLVNVFLVCLLLACGKDNGGNQSPTGPGGGPNGVYGTWNFGAFDQGPIHINVNMRVDANQVTSITECSTQGQKVTAQATAAAEITSSQIKIKEAKEDTKYLTVSGFQMSCNASLDPGSVNYTVNGNQMTMTQDGSSEKKVLTRVN